MSYQVLARKWRPRFFREMVGQEHVLQALINALDHNRLHHAYLFTGTRGVGKTSIARVLAKCLNCEQGVSSEPCGQCSSCQEINNNCFVDLIEVDAASRTKVEDTRELLDNVQYAPSQGRYKIYLIDEVHMLSTHSFNALLKTLEEPPKHCIFLLATTDPQKLPATVISRCIQFKLMSMRVDEMTEHLTDILTKESIAFEARALQHIAHGAKGSMRDALSLLDQAIAYGNQNVSTKAVREMLSIVEAEPLLQLLQAIHAQSPKEVLALIQQLAHEGYQFDRFLTALVSCLHTLIMRQAVPDYDIQDFDSPEPLDALTQSIDAETLQLYYQVALTGQRDIGLAPTLQAGLEMTALRMMVLSAPSNANTAAKAKPVIKAEIVTTVKTAKSPACKTPLPASKQVPQPASEKPVSHVVNTEVTSPKEILQTESSEPASHIASRVEPSIKQKQESASPTAQDASKVIESNQTKITAINGQNWPDFVEALPLKGLSKSLLQNCAFDSMEANSLHLALRPKHKALQNPKQTELIEEAMNAYLGKQYKLHITIKEAVEQTPQDIDDKKAIKARETAEKHLNADPQVQSLKQAFDGKIISKTAELVSTESQLVTEKARS